MQCGNAYSASLVGSWSADNIYDLNINDAVIPIRESAGVSIVAGGSHDLVFSISAASGTGSFELVQSGQVAQLPSRNTYYPLYDAIMVDLIILGNGNNYVYAGIGQETYNPLDISFGVAGWTTNVNYSSVDDFVGTWSLDIYGNPNLRGTANGFSYSSRTGAVSKVSANEISIEIDGIPIILEVNGNQASLLAPVNTGLSMLHVLELVYGDRGMSMYMVASELFDPTDVSVTIGVTTISSVPEPATVWLFGLGLVGIFGFLRRKFII